MVSTRLYYLFMWAYSFICLPVYAQTPNFREWWRQKETQKRYHNEQLAALKLHLNNIRKGVDVVYRGWTTIENIKRGNFNLHRDFFSSFKTVNPHIANSAKVADIIAFQVYILRDMRNVRNFCQRSGHFTPEEIRYVAELYTNMVFLCDLSISELLLILRSDHAEMKDDERLERIDHLHEDMMDKRNFAWSFSYETLHLSLERAKEQDEIKRLQTIIQNQ